MGAAKHMAVPPQSQKYTSSTMSGFPTAVLATADPRAGDEADAIGTTREGRGSISQMVDAPQLDGKNSIYTDKTITFEAFRYWADRSREYEKHIEVGNMGLAGTFKMMTGQRRPGSVSHPVPVNTGSDDNSQEGEKSISKDVSTLNEKIGDRPAVESGGDRHGIRETEWENAQRAGRTATWGAIFYLITTDIFGPSTVPWAISQMGYGPGAALYTVFGGLAFYSGLQLWKMFCGLDSTRYPMRNYGDVGFRIFGNWARHIINILQSFQFFINVCLITVTNGQGLTQMALGSNGNGYICFTVALLVCALTSFLLGQIRTLQKLSWLANLAIWLNVAVLIAT
jgi:hypothetical protein